jgi:hypothetical protein
VKAAYFAAFIYRVQEKGAKEASAGLMARPAVRMPHSMAALPKTIEVSTMFHREPSPAMTTVAALLTQKQHLLSRLEEHPGPNERDEIERLLDKIDAELNAVDRPDRL